MSSHSVMPSLGVSFKRCHHSAFAVSLKKTGHTEKILSSPFFKIYTTGFMMYALKYRPLVFLIPDHHPMKKLLSFTLLFLIIIPVALARKQDTALTQKIDALLHTGTLPPFSGVVWIARKGKCTYAAARGYSDAENKTKVRAGDQFVIGSISKQFTAVMVMQQYELGNIKLDLPVSRYLPQLKQTWADSVTVHHLLSHTHGIVKLDEPAAFPAGSQLAYSQIGYELLAEILEKVSGRSFAALSKELFTRCGMNHTVHPAYAHKGLVKGYTENEKGILDFESKSLINHPAAGGFISTVQDLTLWNEQLHNGKILKPVTYALMMTPKKNAVRQHPIFGQTTYGYGFTITENKGQLQLGQTGYAPGFISMSYYYPEQKRSVVVLSNTVYHTADINQTFSYLLQILNIINEE